MIRAIKGQWITTRNLEERLSQRVSRFTWLFIYLFKAIWYGIRSLRKECLGSQVVFDGKLCYISNWAGSDSPSLCAPGFYQSRVPRAEITGVMSLSELRHRFRFGTTFYLTNWIGIDVNKRVYPKMDWMSPTPKL